jgi:hypothetical protein
MTTAIDREVFLEKASTLLKELQIAGCEVEILQDEYAARIRYNRKSVDIGYKDYMWQVLRPVLYSGHAFDNEDDLIRFVKQELF